MSRHHQPKAFWRLARIWFRHIRITVWLLILLGLLILLYLHNIGLPGFAERVVVRSFAARGVTLEFSRIHLVWFKSIEADDVRVRPSNAEWAPEIECRKLDLHFDPIALLRLKIAPRDLAIEAGQLTLPYPLTNGVAGQLTVTNLDALIRFGPQGKWFLDSLEGDLAGCEFSAAGSISNVAAIRDWGILRRRAAESRGSAHEIWRAISEVRKEIQFLTPPTLRLGFDVDGAAPEKLALWFSMSVESASSPWGLMVNPEVFAKLKPLDDGVCSEVEFRVQIDEVSSEYGRCENLMSASTFSCMAESGSLLAGRSALSAQRVDTLWAGATGLDVSLGWTGDGTNTFPTVAELSLKAAEFSTGQGLAQGVEALFKLSPSQPNFQRSWRPIRKPFAHIELFKCAAKVAVNRLETPWLAATNLAVSSRWSSPELAITNLAADLAGGHLDTEVNFDAVTGRLQVGVTSNFDPQELYSILPREAVVWLDQFTWERPPEVSGVAAVTLPAWDPYPLLWPGDLQPSLYLNGRFEIGVGTFNRIPATGASSHFTYSNMCWSLPDLTVRRPDGFLELEHRNSDRTHEFFWHVNGAVDPTPALILIPEDATETGEILGTLWFGNPPEVDLAMTGNWSDLGSVEAWGIVRATNFAFRGCSFDEMEARVGLTNLTLTVTELRVKTADGSARAASLSFDFHRQLAFLSNGVSTLAPMTVATAIGPDVVKAIEAYRFLKPPSGRVDGVIPLKGVAGADMRFDLQGGPFKWQNFNLQEITGRVLWREETVTLVDVDAEFYGGRAVGGAFFDFTGKRDADFWFNIQVEEADLQPLVIDVFQSTNRLEGRLGGTLSVTNANTGDFGSWFGYGYARLDDGYIWNVPIFGVLSPLLDLFVPGLGSSQADEADGRFVITNGVIRTEDLVFHTSNMRLFYVGTVDFQGTVDAVAEAKIFRDIILVGELVSTVLTPLSKAMIIEITGTLSEPKARPLYLLPRMLLAPLNPVKMLKDLFIPPQPKYQKLPPNPDPAPEHSDSSDGSPPP